MMNKKAIQLSVNFLVIVILSLAVFSMGIIFVNKIFFSASKKVAEMDAQTKQELANLLDQGDKIAMPFFQKSVIHGKTATFGIGVLNTISSLAREDFEIVVEFDAAYKKDNTEITPVSDPDGQGTQENNGWLAYDHSTHEIKPNEQGRYTIAISPPKDAETGVYIFNTAVCYDPDPNPSYTAGDNDDPYKTASTICTGVDSNYYGYYHLQKIWLSVR